MDGVRRRTWEAEYDQVLIGRIVCVQNRLAKRARAGVGQSADHNREPVRDDADDETARIGIAGGIHRRADDGVRADGEEGGGRRRAGHSWGAIAGVVGGGGGEGDDGAAGIAGGFGHIQLGRTGDLRRGGIHDAHDAGVGGRNGAGGGGGGADAVSANRVGIDSTVRDDTQVAGANIVGRRPRIEERCVTLVGERVGSEYGYRRRRGVEIRNRLAATDAVAAGVGGQPGSSRGEGAVHNGIRLRVEDGDRYVRSIGRRL